MARAKNAATRDASTTQLVQGRSVATLGRGLALVKVGKAARVPVRPEDETTVLVKKAAQALDKPGIAADDVFKGPDAQKIFAYAAYPQDPSKIVRKASDGSFVIGHLVDGKFRALKA